MAKAIASTSASAVPMRLPKKMNSKKRVTHGHSKTKNRIQKQQFLLGPPVESVEEGFHKKGKRALLGDLVLLQFV